MVVVGADVHKRTHTFVAVDEVGKQDRRRRRSRRHAGHREALCGGLGAVRRELLWAIEDCRHLSARLERDLLTAGQRWCGCRRR